MFVNMHVFAVIFLQKEQERQALSVEQLKQVGSPTLFYWPFLVCQRLDL
jgi:hypothetical protein